MDSIRGDVLTNARMARQDVRITPSDRGGVTFQTIDYFDVLLESGIIDAFQAELGRKYWRMREVAFYPLGAKTSKFDYRNDDEESLVDPESFAQEGISTETYMMLLRLLTRSTLDLLQACCHTLESIHLPLKMLIIQAYGENAIVRAFNNLEKFMPVAEQEAITRINKPIAS